MRENAVLKKRETLFVLIMIAIIGVMTLHALRVTSKEVFSETSIYSTAVHEIVINVRGAVAAPGRYHFKKGIKLEEIFKTVPLLPEADTSSIDFEQVLKKSRTIRVPRKKEKVKKRALKK